MNNEKKYLLGLTLAELKQVAKDLGMPAFTGGQMAKMALSAACEEHRRDDEHIESQPCQAG